jgi:hypothetical protein
VFLYDIRGPPSTSKFRKSLEECKGSGISVAPLPIADAWPSGLWRRIYNPYEPVRAGSVGPNPTASAIMLSSRHEGRKKEIRYRFDFALEGKATAAQEDRDKGKASL